MRRALCMMISVVVIAAASAIVAPAAQAAPAAKVGDCLAKANIVGDDVDFTSDVACDSPHETQILKVGKLPKSIARLPYGQLSKAGSAAYKKWTQAGYRICSGASMATSIWGGMVGPQVFNALGPGTLIVRPPTEIDGYMLSVGWVLPDEKAWRTGDRSLYCAAHADGDSWSGDLRDLISDKTLPSLRACSDGDGSFITCDRPHDSELIAYWFVRGFPRSDTNSWTAEQWAPWDARCQGAMDALVGAQRSDIYASAEASRALRNEAYGPYKDVTAMYCIVRKVVEEDLPPGTVVGLGTKPLG